ncbi:MAG: hypothetical protein ACR2MQ_07865 [Gemmatimonadaceae bacterium]
MGLLYVSSLGADRDASAYHKSKLEGERIALASALDTTVLRLANVYGPWRSLVQRVAVESGGDVVGGVQTEEESLDDEQAGEVREWLRNLVVERKREEASVATAVR